MLNWFKSKWLLLLVGIILAIGSYALIGFKLLPKIIRSQAIDYAQTEWKKPLTLGEIKVNPFTFELDMRDIVLSEQGKPLLSLKRLFIDFQASSLFKRAYVFNALQFEKPFARAIIKPDGSLNLAELLPKEKDDSPIPNIWIDNLSVQSGQVNFADQSRELKPEKILSPITFDLKNFKTRNTGGGFTLSSSADDGEQFTWQGSLDLQPVSSKGKFSIQGFKAITAYEFLSAELPFKMTEGTFNFNGDYDFAIKGKQGIQLMASLPLISVDKLAIRPKNLTEDWIRLPAIKISNTRVNLAQARLSIAEVNVQGMQAKAWLEPDGSINLLKLTEQGANLKKASASDWQAEIAKLAFSGASIDLEDRTVKPSGKFQLTATEFSSSGISLDFNKPLQIQMSSTINGVAPLRLEGTVLPSNVTAELAVDVSKMPIKQLLMYLPDYPGIVFTSGEVAAKGQIKLDEKANIDYDGDALLTNFVLLDTKNNTDFMSLNNATVQGIKYKQSPESITIDTISLEQPKMEVVVTPQQTINIMDLLVTETAATSQSGAKEAAADLPVSINKIVFRSGTMAFADFSIQPNFKAKIENLNGNILDVSMRDDAVAKIDLNGFVINKFSPVFIKGKTSIFDVEKQTDIQMAFRNIELPVFNPYSGRFAGYAIAKGKLTTELHYRINDKKLVADHHVILDQLTWGEASGSKEAVSLPIRLGTSLLKDKNGVIDLNVPVTGSLDDPQFRVGPIVWQIIKNIFVKVLSAPFSFIGSLFAGAENAQYVDFTPGSADLPEAARSSLPLLAKALVDKPELNLDIPAGVLVDVDSTALAERRFLDAVNASGKPGKNQKPYTEWEPKQQLAALETLYTQKFGNKPVIPKVESTPEQGEAGWREKRAAKKSAEVEWLEAQLKPKYLPSDTELAALGAARGAAVQEALLKDGTLAPTRVFLSTNAPLKVHEGKVRMELAMK